MSGIISCSFRLNLAMLKLVGLYPPKKYSTLYKVYATSLFVLSQTSPLVLGTLHFVFAEDLTAIDYNDYVSVGMICFTVKLLTFLKNSGEIRKCVEYFEDDIILNEDQRSIVEECVSTCKRNSLVFFGGCVAGFVGFIGPTVIEGNMEELPLNVWLPNAWKRTRPVYGSIFFLLILSTAYTTVACGTIDPLIGGLSHHASAQLRILGHCLQFLRHNERKTGHDADIYRKIVKCIQQYQHIANFVRNYQECFSPVVFSQFVGSVLIVGLCCFQLSVMEIDIKFFITALILSLLCFQTFFYCYYGTLLVEENNSLSTAIYMSEWYEYDEQSKKALLVLMERLQKPMIVTAAKILTLSLETFTLILKRTYSFVAVLRNY